MQRQSWASNLRSENLGRSLSGHTGRIPWYLQQGGERIKRVSKNRNLSQTLKLWKKTNRSEAWPSRGRGTWWALGLARRLEQVGSWGGRWSDLHLRHRNTGPAKHRLPRGGMDPGGFPSWQICSQAPLALARRSCAGAGGAGPGARLLPVYLLCPLPHPSLGGASWLGEDLQA